MRREDASQFIVVARDRTSVSADEDSFLAEKFALKREAAGSDPRPPAPKLYMVGGGDWGPGRGKREGGDVGSTYEAV